MKTSELIKKLQEIDKTVPFDADVVIGDDWQFGHLKQVTHDMPRTYLEFEKIPSNDSDVIGDEQYTSFFDTIPLIFELHKAGKLTIEEATYKAKAILMGWEDI